jgi:hypothetical protein
MIPQVNGCLWFGDEFLLLVFWVAFLVWSLKRLQVMFFPVLSRFSPFLSVFLRFFLSLPVLFQTFSNYWWLPFKRSSMTIKARICVGAGFGFGFLCTCSKIWLD